ncbi:ABC transporter permease [Carnobacterium gallinarum]|uniref:ABC transporter permease n=1 Tax=Carnobacterium gallinarum TaxID=2749 RepID=UPI00054EC1D2|nr:ABC transporter permease [Carnobacterium gallinarum]
MFLAWREIKHSKLRYALISLIMIMIIWLVLFVTGLANGLASDNASAIKESPATYYVLEKDSDNRIARSTITEEQWQDMQTVYGKKAVPFSTRMSTISLEKGTEKTDIAYFLLEPDSFQKPTLSSGKFAKENTNEIVVDQKLARNGYKLGDIIEDTTTNSQFKISGFTKNQTYSHSGVVFLSPTQWKEINPVSSKNNTTYNTVALSISENEAEKFNQKELTIAPKNEIVQNIPGYSEEQGSLTMMIVFLYIIAAFVLTVFFYVITLQKMDQFGMLKALGAKTSYLAKSLLTQIGLLSILSLIIGNGLTYGVAAILPESMPFKLSPLTAVLSSLLFLAVTLIGSVLSLYKVAKVDAIEAIGGNN